MTQNNCVVLLGGPTTSHSTKTQSYKTELQQLNVVVTITDAISDRVLYVHVMFIHTQLPGWNMQADPSCQTNPKIANTPMSAIST